MTRWLSTVVAIAAGAFAAAGCNSPVCGDGTKQVQNKNGSVVCVAVDAMPSTIPCDTASGAIISGGKCISALTCGQGTTEINGQCVGTGGGGDSPPPCPRPGAGNICVNGLLHDLVGNAVHKGTVHVAVYDPFAFLGHMPAIAEINTDTGGYVFPDIPTPGLGLLAVAVGDADLAGANNGVTFVTAGSGAQNIQATKSYRVDGYVVKRETVDGWTSQSGHDWFASGGYLARYYSDMKPQDTELAATEMTPVAGVQLTKGGAIQNPPSVNYFTTDLSTLSSSTTSTSAAGAAIYQAVSVANYSGMGGGITWETQMGGTTNKVIFISRFHPN